MRLFGILVGFIFLSGCRDYQKVERRYDGVRELAHAGYDKKPFYSLLSPSSGSIVVRTDIDDNDVWMIAEGIDVTRAAASRWVIFSSVHIRFFRIDWWPNDLQGDIDVRKIEGLGYSLFHGSKCGVTYFFATTASRRIFYWESRYVRASGGPGASTNGDEGCP